MSADDRPGGPCAERGSWSLGRVGEARCCRLLGVLLDPALQLGLVEMGGTETPFTLTEVGCGVPA